MEKSNERPVRCYRDKKLVLEIKLTTPQGVKPRSNLFSPAREAEHAWRLIKALGLEKSIDRVLS